MLIDSNKATMAFKQGEEKKVWPPEAPNQKCAPLLDLEITV